MMRIWLGLLALLACCTEAHAFATCTWTGAGANANWSNPDNWDTCGGIRAVPLDTDTLVFPQGAPDPSKTNTNDLVNLKPAAIELADDKYDISGNSITLSTSLTANTAVGLSGPKFAPAITLGSGATFACETGYFLYLTGGLNLGSYGAVFEGACNTSLKGPISGSGGLYKYGSGTLYLQTGANTYTGTTTINGGTIYVGTGSALGASGPANGTTIKTTTSLTLYLGITLPESLNLNGGTLDNFLGDNRVTGDVSVTAESYVKAASGTTLRIAGPLNGNDNKLNKVGLGNVVIENAGSVGYLVVGGGVLEFNGTSAGGLVSLGTLGGKFNMINTMILAAGGRISPGSAGGANPGVAYGTIFGWTGGGVMQMQLGAKADLLSLGNGFYKSGSGTYAFDFRDGSTPPKIGVTYPLITFVTPPSGFDASSFVFSYTGTGAGSGMAGSFGLTSNALTFTPSAVNSDLIFRDGVEP